ncbi:MAG: histidinol-phosphate transaminase, partial [Myxococcota bacterium]
MTLPLVNDAFETLKPYEPGKPVSETERELGLSGVVKLASNENPLGPSPKALEAVRAHIETLHDYPDAGAFHLKRKLAEFHDVSPEHIVVGNGTNEILEMLIRTVLRDGENVVYADPSFVVYKLCTLSAGRDLRSVPLKDMRYDLPAMADAVDAKTKLVFLANPNNPTGTYVTQDEFNGFLAAIPDDVLVVMDEAYTEYVDAPDYPDAFATLGKRERYMISRTFSKCYGLAGLRIGYGIANPELVNYLNRGRQPFNTNSLAQVAAIAALDDQEHVKNTVDLNRREMTRVVPELERRGLRVTPSQANFVLADAGRDGQALF